MNILLFLNNLCDLFAVFYSVRCYIMLIFRVIKYTSSNSAFVELALEKLKFTFLLPKSDY